MGGVRDPGPAGPGDGRVDQLGAATEEKERRPVETTLQASPVDALAERFWEAFLELNPTTATLYGDERYDDRLEDPGPQGRARGVALARETIAAAEAMDPTDLSVEDRITRELLLIICRLALEEEELGLYRLAGIDQVSGPQTVLPQVAQFQRADNPERLERFLARLRAYPAYLAAHVENLREGIQTGLTAPRVIVSETIEQLEGLLAVPPEAHPVTVAARVADEADRGRVAEVVAAVVRPAEGALVDFLRREYLPASREAPGLWAVPNGEALYRQRIRAWTTLDLDPRQLHQTGLALLEEIEEERRQISRAAGFGNDTAAYRASLAADPTNVPGTAEELLERARSLIARAMEAAPRAFGRLPRTGVEVRAVEPYKERTSPFAYYYPPAADGSRPGIYYANTYDLPSRLFSRLATTTFHEAIPGHHFQIALEMEHPRLNRFRRLGSRLAGGAFAEGWGLYAERLADELGLFSSQAERFGMLDAQAWRAARLVVDTGLHALGWSRQEALEFLRRAGLPETDAAIETDRYIVWPGQALSYMTGQLEIQRLRREIAARLGSAFDLRRFHDEVLAHGSLPLAILRRELPAWLRVGS